MKAIHVTSHGDAQVLKWAEVKTPSPQGSQVLVEVKAAGVNFIDIYHRRGIYPVQLPFTPGLEGAGVVREVGPDAQLFKPGDRVAFTHVPGAYAEMVCAPEEKFVKVPNGIEFETAAACMLQGMTAYYLSHETFALKKGDTCVVHSAAGGVGLLLVQLAKYLGARVIGVVSTLEKAKLATEAGADEVIVTGERHFKEEVLRMTNNKGVQVIYDAVGKDTFLDGIDCLVPRGMMVLYGQSSGSVEAFDPSLLAQKSLFLTRPVLFHYVPDHDKLTQHANAVFRFIQDGVLKIRIHESIKLNDAKEAHEKLESRRTTGKVLLVP